jgi:hypothetical protein
MIKGFSEETQPLTEYERKVILPIIENQDRQSQRGNE